jgi:hypothetical protein
MITTNTKIETPIGEGISQGSYAVRDSTGEIVRQAVLVRLPVNDTTRAHLNEANCLTPGAHRSALFVFPTSENGHARSDVVEALFWLGIVFIVLFMCAPVWPW